jgi:hypothetical protein
LLISAVAQNWPIAHCVGAPLASPARQYEPGGHGACVVDVERAGQK